MDRGVSAIDIIKGVTLAPSIYVPVVHIFLCVSLDWLLRAEYMFSVFVFGFFLCQYVAHPVLSHVGLIYSL